MVCSRSISITTRRSSQLLALLSLMLALLPTPLTAATCDYVSTATGPCDSSATDGSCADYYQVFAALSYQNIQSPSYPDSYPDNTVCRWVVSACNCYDPLRPGAKFRAEVEMLDFELQDSPSCTRDYVEVKDAGTRLWGHSRAQFCGNDCANGDNITLSRDSHLLVTFQTDVFDATAPQKFRGFHARYRCAEYETLITDDVVLGRMNYFLIGFTCLLAILFSSAAVLLVVREHRRSCHLID